MKITGTNDQMNVKVGGLGQLIIGLVFIVLGIALTVFILSGPKDSTTGKAAPTWLAIMGVAFALVGILVALTAKNLYITMQRGGDTTMFAKRLLGGKSQHQSFPTGNIKAVELSTSTQLTGGANQAGPSRQSTLFLIMADNSRVTIASGSKGSSSINGLSLGFMQKAPLSNEANQIAQFLNVPVQSDGTGSLAQGIGDLVETVKDKVSGPTGESAAPPVAGTPATPTPPAGPAVVQPTVIPPAGSDKTPPAAA